MLSHRHFSEYQSCRGLPLSDSTRLKVSEVSDSKNSLSWPLEYERGLTDKTNKETPKSFCLLVSDSLLT